MCAGAALVVARAISSARCGVRRGRHLWNHREVTSVGIVGAGRGATLHAETVRVSPGMELAGVSASSQGSPRAAALAGGLDCPVLALPELARACDLAVVATPPASCPEAVAHLAASPRVRAVLVESPVGITVESVDRLREALAPRPVMVGANLLHAPAVRRLLEAIASMDPHHLVLRLAVPDPARPAAARPAFGGGVMMDPAAGFWPVLIAALGAEVVAVSTPSLRMRDGLEVEAEVVLMAADGRRARAQTRWGACIAEASVEAADNARVARVEIWPEPLVEIDGVPVQAPSTDVHPLSALGFLAQLDRLDRVGRGEAAPWPDLTVGSAALTVVVAAAMSACRGGDEVAIREVPRDLSPFVALSSMGRAGHR